MNKPESRILIMASSECLEWPEAVNRAFQQLVDSARDEHFSVICVVGLNHREKHLSVQFSPHSSSNPDIADMSQDIGEMFALVARRFRQ